MPAMESVVHREQVVAAAAVAQAVAVAVALVVATLQLRAAAALRRDQSRAYVVAYLDSDAELRQFPMLVVENLGATAAYDITLNSDPPLRSSFDGASGLSLAEVGMLEHGIPMLAPGQRLDTLFDSTIARSLSKMAKTRSSRCSSIPPTGVRSPP